MIELRELAVGYEGKTVLRDLSLEFPAGCVTVLLGPNGCGKSTLLKTVAGLQPALSGRILLDEQPVEELSRRQLAQKLAYLPQFRAIPDISAFRMVLHGRFPYLSYPRRYTSADYEIARAALARADAAELADCPMPTLSGGQRQKIYLAMALAQDTETVLMDEPTAFLDVRHQLETMSIARSLAGEGRAVVLVLHDLCLALRSADKIAVLHEGHLRQWAAPDEVFAAGELPGIFGVGIRRVETPAGWRYYYE